MVSCQSSKIATRILPFSGFIYLRGSCLYCRPLPPCSYSTLDWRQQKYQRQIQTAIIHREDEVCSQSKCEHPRHSDSCHFLSPLDEEHLTGVLFDELELHHLLKELIGVNGKQLATIIWDRENPQATKQQQKFLLPRGRSLSLSMATFIVLLVLRLLLCYQWGRSLQPVKDQSVAIFPQPSLCVFWKMCGGVGFNIGSTWRMKEGEEYHYSFQYNNSSRREENYL